MNMREETLLAGMVRLQAAHDGLFHENKRLSDGIQLQQKMIQELEEKLKKATAIAESFTGGGPTPVVNGQPPVIKTLEIEPKE